MKKEVIVTHPVIVEIDETKFTEEFMEEFRQSFYPFFTLEDHLGHLAQLFTRGIVDNGEFIEGYGPAKEMGISFKEISGGLYTDVEGLDIPSR